jgi:membrane-bound ClpP family serine protease
MLVMLLVMFFPVFGLVLFEWMPLRASPPSYLLGLGLSVVLHHVTMRTKALPVKTGREGLKGQPARVLVWRRDEGWVRCGAERWQAVGRPGLALHVGDRVRVLDVVDLTLVVDRPDGGATGQAAGQAVVKVKNIP